MGALPPTLYFIYLNLLLRFIFGWDKSRSGLHPDVFTNFIDFTEENDWEDYENLLNSTAKKVVNTCTEMFT